ncbi:MAG: flagellar basal body-associated FliL family protein [Proteobacteria bacterium]|nr:flagellar basal body-associated FliL family protein [Pseudomonadota bacterium]
MARDKNKKDAQAGGGFGSLVISALLAIALGVIGGGAFGYFVLPDGVGQTAQAKSESAAQAQPVPGRFPSDAIELSVPSVITELGTDMKMRARLDVSIIVAHGTPESTTLVGEVREDMIAYLKGLTVADIQGVRGFQNLREQLDDRARVRGRGAILGLLIGGLVLE